MIDQLEFYQARLKIDKDNLDEEVANFPSSFFTVSDFYVDADRIAKRLEVRLHREMAALSHVFREAAEEEHGKRGYTETQIKQEVQLHPRYRKLAAKHRQAVYVKERWQVLKEAMVQKSFSLKGLVSLSMHEHFQNSTATLDSGRSNTRTRRS